MERIEIKVTLKEEDFLVIFQRYLGYNYFKLPWAKEYILPFAITISIFFACHLYCSNNGYQLDSYYILNVLFMPGFYFLWKICQYLFYYENNNKIDAKYINARLKFSTERLILDNNQIIWCSNTSQTIFNIKSFNKVELFESHFNLILFTNKIIFPINSISKADFDKLLSYCKENNIEVVDLKELGFDFDY